MISARGLGRRFGPKRVLRDLDLDVRSGEMLLVTGPNGSGKSTLLALMAGLLAPTEGELEVDLPRGRIGYLAHEPLVYKELTALENLDLYGRLYHVRERALENFRSGRGMEWGEHHPCLFSGTERFFRASYNSNLLTSWLPSLDGAVEKLKAGARVADVGCGHGASTILMAQAFPASRFRRA